MSVALSEMTDGNESEITPHLLYSALYVPPSILFVWLVYTNINIFHHITGNVTERGKMVESYGLLNFTNR